MLSSVLVHKRERDNVNVDCEPLQKQSKIVDAASYMASVKTALQNVSKKFRKTYCNFIGGCNKNSFWGYDFGSRIFCGEHKEQDMIDCFHRKCEHKECTSFASFGLPGEPKRFCAEHKTLSEMVNGSVKCKENGCKTTAKFGEPGTNAKYCKTHRLESMVNVTDKTCNFDGCSRHPTYALPGEKAKFCLAHKESDMEDVKHTLCQTQECSKRAYYGTGKKRTHCGDHADAGMTSSDKRCAHKGCDTRSSSGHPGTSKSHCAEHKLPGMVFLKYVNCIEKGCNNKALNGIPGTFATHCDGHKLDSQVNMVEQKCTNCDVTRILDGEGKCESCNHIAEEVYQNSRLYEQKLVIAYLTTKGYKFDFTDVQLKAEYDPQCTTSTRPDLIWDLWNEGLQYFVILEIDEHQHRYYNKECETTRIINIGEAIIRKGIVIRYNPHSFKVKDRSKTVSFTDRMQTLTDVLDIALVKADCQCLERVHLFYDEFENENIEFEVVRSNEN